LGGDFSKQFAEVRLLDLIKPPGSILRRISPWVRRRAYEAPAWRLAVTEIEGRKRDQLVNDAGGCSRVCWPSICSRQLFTLTSSVACSSTAPLAHSLVRADDLHGVSPLIS
jgi:hypothetical protein